MWYLKAVLLQKDIMSYVTSMDTWHLWYFIKLAHGLVHWYEKGYHIPRRTREAATSGVDWCCVPSQDMPSGFWWVLCTAGVAQIVVAISCVWNGTRMTFGRNTHGPFWRHPKFAIDTLHYYTITQFNFVAFLISPRKIFNHVHHQKAPKALVFASFGGFIQQEFHGPLESEPFAEVWCLASWCHAPAVTGPEFTLMLWCWGTSHLFFLFN